MKGKVHKFADDVNTDEIIPACYLTTTDEKALAAHCMEGADPQFAQTAQPGDMIVAGKNFGCGSSREHAPLSVKALGISCVVAESFARIFFRNAINIGLPLVECVPGAREARPGDEMEVDVRAGKIINVTQDTSYDFEPYAEEIQRIIESGGLMNFVKGMAGGT